MAAKHLGEIRMTGTVYIHWENGTQTAVGTVDTYVQMSLKDDDIVTLNTKVEDTTS
jgi:hypothetical protein